ncbi:MAG TPA: hypothetical protein VI112_01645 [Bacteroidia bacterium]
MKRAIHLLLLFCPLVILGQKQGIQFKIQYLPEHVYSQTIDQTVHTEIRSGGDKKPRINTRQTRTQAVIKTGKLNGSEFPVTMEFAHSTGNQEKQPIPDGTILFGKISEGKAPVFDSIYSPDMDNEIKKLLLQNLQSIMVQIPFPDAELKPGEKFTQEIPFSLPMAGETIVMLIRMTYKLKKVENGLAYFDIRDQVTLKKGSDKFKVSSSGKGQGSFVYDLSSHFPTEYDAGLKLKMKANISGTVTEVEMDNSTHQQITITTVQ